MEIIKIKQGDTITLAITGTGVDGEGVGRYGNFVVFVPFALPSDTIEARIVYVKKSFATAVLKRIVTPSPFRVVPPCNRFTRCGGCTYLNLVYDQQVAAKRENLVMTLKKGAAYNGEVQEVVTSEPLAYRNKLQLPFGMTDGNVSLGFYQGGTHKVVSIGKCFLHADWAEKLITVLKDWANRFQISVYTDENKNGLLRHVVARSISNKLQVTLVINGETVPKIDSLVTLLKQTFSDISIFLNINKEDTNVILGERLIPIDTHKQELDIFGVKAEVNPFSFLQINDAVRDTLYKNVLTSIQEMSKGIAERVVVDAYAGIGILGVVLAKNGTRVYNLEIIKEATRDADMLAKTNGVAALVTNKTGDSADLLSPMLEEIAKSHIGAEVTVLLDPPRKGCDKAVIEAIINAAETIPLSVIYISCNPATLARDLSLLAVRFDILKVTPFDMFPNTPHIETLVVLCPKSTVEKESRPENCSL